MDMRGGDAMDVQEKTSKELLKEFTARIYEEIRETKAASQPIGWSTSNFPKEVCETFGLKIMYPENHAAALAAKHGAIDYCERAESMGYSSSLCSYARISLGFLHRDEDFDHGLNVPAPDFLCGANNICTTVIKWYENLARELDIPLIMLNVPYNTDGEFTPNKTKYMRAQLQGAIEQFKEITQTKFDYAKFHEVIARSSHNSALFKQALDLIGATKPAPANGFGRYNFMALMTIARASLRSSSKR